ncbi:MAG: heparinase II/III family protein [Oscillospiraceae bacterium]|nr:heparinase II/III family protein [Oscillospiraceae bacterium]
MQTRKFLRAVSSLLAAAMCVAFVPSFGTIGASAASAEPLKTRSTVYTAEKVANARENIEKYDWAKEEADQVIKTADTYVEKGLDFWWGLVTSQQLPRSYGVNQTFGCPNCGKEIDAYGNYPYVFDVLNEEWKMTCPNCGMKFPTNDFSAYYKSSLDENGNFIKGKGDSSLLKNTLYPEKGEKWGVDDGFGYVAPDGKKYTFIAHYNHFALWYANGIQEDILRMAAEKLSLAYVYTGEQKYADAAIVLLDRVADVYPDMSVRNQKVADGFLHSHGGGGTGKVVGCIWETVLVVPFLKAYDAVFNAFPSMSSEAMKLLSDKSGGKKSNYKDIMVNIEDNFVKRIFPAVKSGDIYGNTGMHQYALALAAVVIDDKTLTKQWLDFDFQSGTAASTGITGGNIYAGFVNSVDRDGFGNEAAPGYNNIWLNMYSDLAQLLKGYTINGTEISYDLYNLIKYKKMFYSMLNLIIMNKMTPCIGDSGNTGWCGIVANNTNLIPAYCVYKDEYLAQAIYLVNGNSTDGLVLSIFDKDPEALTGEIKGVIEKSGKLKSGSVNLAGYGFVALKNISEAKTEEPKKIEYPKSVKYDFSELKILNASLVTGVEKSGNGVTFTSSENQREITFCFYLDNAEAVYDLPVTLGKGNTSGKFDVYVDGRLIQSECDFKSKPSEVNAVYFKKTVSLAPGLHMLTFDSVAAGESICLVSFGAIRQSSDEGSGVAASINQETDLTVYYGRNTGHGHLDNLNLELYAFGMDLMPDLGYPEFADTTPHRMYWVMNTVSHNTVLVNDAPQDGSTIASDIKYFDDSELVKLISVDGAAAYSAASEYRRTSALIKVSDTESYAIDLFRVKGGNNHTYSFHPAEFMGDTIITGLNLTPQGGGTLAGKNVEWGTGTYSSGYQFLSDVRTDAAPTGSFSIDWSIKDTWGSATANDIHLKLSMLGALSSVNLAVGTPPRNKPGNPKALDYVLARRVASDSLFTAVIEPYSGASFVKSSELAVIKKDGSEYTGNDARAVKVTLKNGRVDYLMYSEDGGTYEVDGKYEFKGFFAIVSEYQGDAVTYVMDASVNNISIDRLTGKVADFTSELTDKNYLTASLDSDVDPSALAGRYVYVSTISKSVNGAYKIFSAEKKDGKYVLDVGDITFVSSYKSASDINSGYNYYFAKDALLYIPVPLINGDASKLYTNSLIAQKPLFSALTASHSVRADAKAGDFAASLYAVPLTANEAYEIPEYKISLTEGGDSEYFELRDGKLYMKEDCDTDKKAYELVFNVESGDWSSDFPLTLKVMSKSQSGSTKYPTFSLINLEKAPDNKPGDLPIYVYVIIGAFVLAALSSAVIINEKKKKSK